MHDLKFTDSYRFIATCLSNLIENLSEKVYKSYKFVKCINRKDFLEYEEVISKSLICHSFNFLKH